MGLGVLYKTALYQVALDLRAPSAGLGLELEQDVRAHEVVRQHGVDRERALRGLRLEHGLGDLRVRRVFHVGVSCLVAM